MQADHIPVPTEHSPNRNIHHDPDAFVGAVVHEVDGDDAWVWSDTTVEVRE